MTRLHPAGAVTVGLERTATEASITSPACTLAGLGITRLLATGFAAKADERNAMVCCGTVTFTWAPSLLVAWTPVPPYVAPISCEPPLAGV